MMRKTRRALAFCLTVCAVALGAASAMPAAADPVVTQNVTARLLAEHDTVAPGARLSVLLHFRIREGWHTYWRNPGDSGEATRIDWQLPDGVTAGPIQWPYPHRLPYGPLVNHGYKGDAFHLTEISVPKDWPADGALTLRASAYWLVCEEICIPEEGTFELVLPGGPGAGAPNPDNAELFAAARRLLPVSSQWTAGFDAGDDGVTLSLAAPGIDADRIADAHFFPHDWGVVEPAAPQSLALDRDGLRLTMTAGAAPVAERLDGVLVLTSRTGDGTVTRGLVVNATPAAPGAVATADPISIGLVEALLFALLGGLILNLMPCVFPVLSMKALALLGHAHDGRATVRRHGLAYTAGVLLCFGALAGALISLKAGGAAVGWGFQLQSPIFVAAMAYLLFFLGLSLSGVVTIGGAVMWIGSRLAQGGGYSGSFFTGVLAAVVATPCTAPFMGAAIGFALTRDAVVSVGVFLALGLGLALPYLLLTFVPALTRVLPRPGPWMERAKQFLAFPLYASVAWLIWVLSLQAGPDGVAAALAGLVLIAFAAWLWRTAATSQRGGRAAALTAALAAGGLAVASLVVLPQQSAPTRSAQTQAETDGPAFEPYSPARLATLRAEGRPVFVNMTAAWCITCLVNERVALSSPEIGEAFARRGLVYLKGDWTNRDPEITALLESFGRNGVPLYAIYPADGDAPRLLPQLLTEALVLDALREIPIEPNILTQATERSSS